MTTQVTHEELEAILKPIQDALTTLERNITQLHQGLSDLQTDVAVLKEDIGLLRKDNVQTKSAITGLSIGQSHVVRLIAITMTPEQRDAARALGIPL